MNLRFTLLFYLFFPLIINAQITIEAVDLPTIGDDFALKIDTLEYPISSGGINQTWDYSDMIAFDSFSVLLVHPDSCLNATDFPEADFCRTNLTGNSSNFFSTTNGGLKVEGFVLEDWFNQGDYSVVYDPTDVLLPVPLSFDTTYTDSSAFSIFRDSLFPGDNAERSNITLTSTTTIDGWGTLILPTGSFEVLRAYQVTLQTNLNEEFKDNEWVETSGSSSERHEIIFLSKEGFNTIFTQIPDPIDPSIVLQSNWYESVDFSTSTAPVADFEFEIDMQQGFTTIDLKDKSMNWPTSFEWTANGNIIGTNETVFELYQTDTTIDFCLSVSNSAGSDQICKTIDIIILRPPIALFISNESPAFSGNYTFTNFSNTAGAIVENTWLIDGEIISNEKDLNYQFTADGEYEVCLLIEDEFQQFALSCETIVVTLGVAPQADFNFERLTDPIAYVFTDVSTNVPTSWLWDFGDGNTSTEQNPTHLYTTDSMFTVCLTATNDFGMDENCQTVNVNVHTSKTTFPESWKLFPSPSSDFLNVTFAETIPYGGVLAIFNSTGQRILQQTIQNNIELNINHLPTGTYILNIINASGKQYSNRFIKL